MFEICEAPAEYILIIEDAPDTAQHIAHALDQKGYPSVCAVTGADGLARLQEQSFSLVIVDAALPDGNGYQTCQSIKKRNPLLPVILLGVQSSIAGDDNGSAAEADEYLGGQFDQVHLLTRVETMLRSYRTQCFLIQCSQRLQLVGEIGLRLTSILDLDRLLSEVVWLTQRAFSLACVGVGLLEDNQVLWRVGFCTEHGQPRDRHCQLRARPIAFA